MLVVYNFMYDSLVSIWKSPGNECDFQWGYTISINQLSIMLREKEAAMSVQPNEVKLSRLNLLRNIPFPEYHRSQLRTSFNCAE